MALPALAAGDDHQPFQAARAASRGDVPRRHPSSRHETAALMSLLQWGLAILWVGGVLIVAAVVLTLVALADPARRHRSRDGAGGPRP